MQKKGLFGKVVRFAGKLARNSAKRLNLALAIASSIFIVFAAFIYIRSQDKTEMTLVEQTFRREQVIAKAGAKSIESFFELFGAQMATFSTRSAIATQNLEDAQIAMDLFVDKWQDTAVGGIVLLGEDGKVLVNANRLKTPETGMDFSDRDYFVWAKDAKPFEVFVSKSMVSRLGASKGKYIVVVATPVLANGEFGGVLAASIILSELTDIYLTPLKVSQESQVYLLNQEGIILSSTISELPGKNFTQYIKANPFPGSNILLDKLKETLTLAFEKGEGTLDYFRNSPEDKKSLKRWLLAYSAVNLRLRGLEQPESLLPLRWLLAVETPAEEAFVHILPFSILQTTSFVITVLGVIAFSLLLILVVRVIKRDSYLRGFSDGRDHKGRT